MDESFVLKISSCIAAAFFLLLCPACYSSKSATDDLDTSTGRTDKETETDPPSVFCAEGEPGDTVSLAELQSPGGVIRLDDTSIYIMATDPDTGDRGVYRIDKYSAGTALIAAASTRYTGAFVLDGDYLYMGSSDGTLARVSKEGGDVTTFDVDTGSITNLAVNGDTMFIGTRPSGTLWYGGVDSLPDLSVLMEGVDAFGVSDDRLYYVQGHNVYERVPYDGDASLIWDGMEDPYSPVVQVKSSDIFLFDESAMVNIDLDSGIAKALPWPHVDDNTPGFDADGDDAYFASHEGGLWWGSIASPDNTSMVAPSGAYDFEENGAAVAIDGDVVYWTAPPFDPPFADEDSPFNLYRTCR